MIGPQDRAAIEALHRAWLDAELRGESSALLHLCTPAPVWLPPNEPPLCGTAAILRWLEDGPRVAVRRIEIDGLEISGGGSLAWKTAAFRTTFEGPAGQVGVVTGSHVWLLQKNAAAEWRISVVAWTITDEE